MDYWKLLADRKMINTLDSGEVVVAGWVYDQRDLGKVRFLVLRDFSGEIQVTAHKDKSSKEIFDLMQKVSRESVILISGKIQKSDRAPGGKELVPEYFEILAVAESPKRLDYRFLDMHRRRTQAIFKIQHTLSTSFKDFFVSKNFIEMQPPCLIGVASEGGADVFKVKYFDKEACLAQSPQLYKEMVACSMEKTFMITPVWRAEKHNTVRHINEIRQLDIECAFMSQMDVMKLEEEAVKHMISEVVKKNKSEIELLGLKIKVPTAKYISYDETITVLKKAGIKIAKGDDFNPEAEKKLGELYPDTLVFVHSWPASLKPFYIMPKDGDSKAEYSESFDCIYNGMEITSGGQRIHLPELLIAKIKQKGLKIEGLKDYIDSFRYGAPPHSGWSIGLERLTMIVTGQDNIREATMFPRDRDRLTP
ncbi:aspartate--tRNA(Asn) ligase [Candidatus Pacearchaeota archaeon]|nr:aspartate--tRNA(Asn) ligase [Candidatus Pacearchaeota archaeon]